MENYIGFQVHYFDYNGYFVGAEDMTSTITQARGKVERKFAEDKGWTIEYTGHFSGKVAKDNEPWFNKKFSIRGVDTDYKPQVL